MSIFFLFSGLTSLSLRDGRDFAGGNTGRFSRLGLGLLPASGERGCRRDIRRHVGPSGDDQVRRRVHLGDRRADILSARPGLPEGRAKTAADDGIRLLRR